MSRWKEKFVAIFAVASVLLSFASAEVACASGNDHDADATPGQHHCVCHGAAVPATVSAVGEFLTDKREFALVLPTGHSRLVPASIFNPPRA